MPQKNALISGYMLATRPLRWWCQWTLRRKSQIPVAGLFLHRVADDHPNDWTITVEQFDRMIAWLENHVDLVSMDEAQRRIRHGNPGRMAVNISFDDGYADNCLHAIPALLKKKIPFTYYVATQNVRNGKPFPHDLKQGQPLAPNSIDEIRAMANAGVEIGAHTRTHADIGRLTRHSELEYEIRGSREDLWDWIGYQPRHFAFPFGLKDNIPPRAIQFVHDEGFDSYCSAQGGYNFPTLDDAFHFRRFHGDPVYARVINWLSFDPRWIYATPDFEYRPIKRRSNRPTIVSPLTSKD